MKDFNRIILNIPKGAFGLKTEDAMERFEKRPLLVPSLILFVSCCLTFLTASLLPVVFIMTILITLLIFAAGKRNVTWLFEFVLCFFAVVYCSYSFVLFSVVFCDCRLISFCYCRYNT